MQPLSIKYCVNRFGGVKIVLLMVKTKKRNGSNENIEGKKNKPTAASRCTTRNGGGKRIEDKRVGRTLGATERISWHYRVLYLRYVSQEQYQLRNSWSVSAAYTYAGKKKKKKITDFRSENQSIFNSTVLNSHHAVEIEITKAAFLNYFNYANSIRYNKW